MTRRVVVGAILIAVGAAVGAYVTARRAPIEPLTTAARSESPELAPQRGFGGVAAPAAGPSRARSLAREIERLTARLDEEAGARRRLEERLEAVAQQLAALGRGAHAAGRAAAGASSEIGVQDGAVAAPSPDEVNSAQHALIVAGVDAATAAEITRRADEMTMAEMYLRDQAAREQWLDSPRFAEEMAALEQQRVSIRDEIGDDAYDRYLFALGDPNRVRIEEVLGESPAAAAGLRRGDIVLRYGDARLFTPSELVAKTRGGTIGELVRLEIVRDGKRLEVEVPRGPLGLRINVAKNDPVAG